MGEPGPQSSSGRRGRVRAITPTASGTINRSGKSFDRQSCGLSLGLEDYLLAMERSTVRDTAITSLLAQALSDGLTIRRFWLEASATMPAMRFAP